MEKKNIIASLSLTLLIIATVGSQSQTIRRWLSFETKAAAAAGIPTHILYDQLFRLVITFQRRSIEQKVSGKTVTSLPEYFKNAAGLTDERNQKLQEIAADFMQDVEPVDARAADIIFLFRESYPDGVIPTGEHVAQPPEDLVDLQNERNILAMNYRGRLSEAFGEKDFDSFDAYIHDKFAQNFQTNGTSPQRGYE